MHVFLKLTAVNCSWVFLSSSYCCQGRGTGKHSIVWNLEHREQASIVMQPHDRLALYSWVSQACGASITVRFLRVLSKHKRTTTGLVRDSSVPSVSARGRPWQSVGHANTNSGLDGGCRKVSRSMTCIDCWLGPTHRVDSIRKHIRVATTVSRVHLCSTATRVGMTLASLWNIARTEP